MFDISCDSTPEIAMGDLRRGSEPIVSSGDESRVQIDVNEITPLKQVATGPPSGPGKLPRFGQPLARLLDGRHTNIHYAVIHLDPLMAVKDPRSPGWRHSADQNWWNTTGPGA